MNLLEQKMLQAQNSHMPSSGNYGGHKDQDVPPSQKWIHHFFRAKIYLVVTRIQSGRVFFFSLKTIVSIRQEKQNTEDIVKTFLPM